MWKKWKNAAGTQSSVSWIQRAMMINLTVKTDCRIKINCPITGNVARLLGNPGGCDGSVLENGKKECKVGKMVLCRAIKIVHYDSNCRVTVCVYKPMRSRLRISPITPRWLAVSLCRSLTGLVHYVVHFPE